MSRITTHVLDTARGRPAAGIPVRLEGPAGHLGDAVTDHDGRVADLGPERLEPGTYRLTFDVAAYDRDSFFPQVAVTFRVTDDEHHHVPLLLAPFTYSTYRGS